MARPEPPSLFDDPDSEECEEPTTEEVLELAVSLAKTLNETNRRLTLVEEQLAALLDPCRRTGGPA